MCENSEGHKGSSQVPEEWVHVFPFIECVFLLKMACSILTHASCSYSKLPIVKR